MWWLRRPALRGLQRAEQGSRQACCTSCSRPWAALSAAACSEDPGATNAPPSELTAGVVLPVAALTAGVQEHGRRLLLQPGEHHARAGAPDRSHIVVGHGVSVSLPACPPACPPVRLP